MSSVSKLAVGTTACREAIDMAIGNPGYEGVRAKRLRPRSEVTPTLSPIRREGRAEAARILHSVLAEDETETQHRVARLLGVTHSVVQAWCNPADKRQFPVGDLVALALAGSPTVVYAYLDELARFLVEKIRTSRTDIEHACEIAKASGAVASALTESSDRTARLRALRKLKLRCDEAIADTEAR